MRINSFITISLFVTLSSFTGYAKDKLIAIIASGETHAMLDACDCPQDPAGGLPKRSQIINELRKEKEVLLLDAGGYAGGGIYDFYTGGRQRDSVRTLLTIKAMGEMGYDAAAIGDEELQYGAKWLVTIANKAGLPLISANCYYATGKHVTEPYRVIKKGDVTFGITAVTTLENLFPVDTSVIIKDPVKSIKSIWKELNRKSDYRIILSHLGEEKTIQLGKHFPGCTILVNGHRKTSIQPVMTIDKQTVMQFGFQGKNLSEVDFNTIKKSFSPIKDKWIDIDYNVSDDAGILGIISGEWYDQFPRMTVIDLYLMSKCPYGIPALKDLLQLQDRFHTMELNIWFIGDVNPDGSIHSLGGKQEINDEMLWLAVKNIFPELWESFLYLCAYEDVSVFQALSDLEIDTAKVNKWIKEKGEEELANHYQRSMRLKVNASPTMFVNNYIFGSEISYLRLAKDFCRYVEGPKKPLLCDSLPECFEDRDCRVKGKIGLCSSTDEGKGGKCTFKDAVEFDFTVVIPDNPVIHTEQDVIATTSELFPGAAIKTYPMSSNGGKKFLHKVNPSYLPLYLFDKQVNTAHNYPKIESGLIRKGEWYTFKEDVMQKQYFLKRKIEKGTVSLFIDPLFTDADKVLKTVFKLFPDYENVTIKPIVYESTLNDNSAPEEKIRQEEALRWLVLLKYYGIKKYSSYLNSYLTKPGSSQWFSSLKKIKVNVDGFVKKTGKNHDLLKELLNEIRELGIDEPVVLLVDNREVIPIRNPSYFEEILKKVKKRFTEGK